MSREAPGPAMESARYRGLRWFFSLLILSILVGAVLFQSLILPGGLVFVIGLGGLPLVGYIAWVRTRIGSIAAGSALLALALAVALNVTAWMERGSDLAGMGYLYLPIIGFPILLVTFILEKHLHQGAHS